MNTKLTLLQKRRLDLYDSRKNRYLWSNFRNNLPI